MTDTTKPDGARGSQTLARGLSILGALRDAPEGLSVADLVRALGLHRPIVTRLLATLEDERYVERSGSRAYRLGPELIALGKAVRSDLRDLAATVLRDLAEHVGATAVLVLRDDAHAVVISVVEPMHTDLRLSFRLGSRHLLHQGAEGMAILAGNPPVRGERPEVTRARESGYVVSAGEILPGTWGLAVPVVTGGGRCEMSVGVIAAQALDESKTSRLVLEATDELAPRISLGGELR
ncbi:MAG: IclR family transcriptional regulator [Acidimicrobiaceae bacterium]|jgi:DNA-binding IclR family transcriptional regulator|nr:IclR family transcriptional regulator [Acidimicrobiaceae bacterium]